MELLSPAGSKESLKAAIANGADAVYLGVQLFNARRLAANFKLAELADIVFLAHLHGVKVYLTMNTLVRNNELERWFEVLKKAYESGIDAVIVQEITFARLIKDSFPEMEVHASTQASIMNARAMKLFPDVDLFVLARELNADQIKFIRKQTKKKIEIFVHGHQCISVSGQCLISSLIGSRSGNRGVCASSCRKRYNHKGYLISAKDLNLSESVKEIFDLGIDAIKIEGRMKSPEYVGATTNTYRNQLDFAHQGKVREIPSAEKKTVELSFNREFTKGFFNDVESIVGEKMPMNRGILLGRVERGFLRLAHPLSLYDGVSFWDGRVFSGSLVNWIEIDGRRVESAKKGDTIKLANFKAGMEVYLTASNKGKEPFKTLHKPLLKLKIEGKEGTPLTVTWKDGITSSIPLQRANKIALTPEYIKEHFKTMSAQWAISWHVEPNLFLPNKILSELKAGLEAQLREYFIPRRESLVSLPNIKETKGPHGLYVKVYTVEDVEIADALGVDVIYFDLFSSDVYEAKKACKNAAFYVDTPIIMTDADIKKAEQIIARLEPTGVMAGNWGAFSLKGKKHGKYSLNTFNDLSIAWLKKQGVTPMISVELSGKQLKDLRQKDFIYYAHGRIPVMHFKGEYAPHALKDEKDYVFPLRLTNGNTEMLHSRPFAAFEHVKELQEIGINQFFLDLDQNVSVLIQAYQAILEGRMYDTSHLKEGTTLKPFKMGVG